MCKLFIENFNFLILFKGMIIILLVVMAIASVVRAKNHDWDFSFLLKPYAEFEHFNPKKYGIFAVVRITIFAVLVSVILLGPSLLSYCH